MAYSYVQYTGNAVTVAFSIPFQYLSAGYLEVRLGGVLTTAYTLPSAAVLQMNVAPGNGVILEIRRNTPKTARLVDFQDASILTEASLDLDSDQSFHVTQEAFDAAEASLRLISTNVYDALSKRITNLADPVNPQDAATKAWCETGPIAAAAASATASQNYSISSFNFSMDSSASAGAAAVSASEALTYRNNALTYKTNAATSATAAATSATAAAASELAASGYAVLAVGDVIGEFSYQAPSHSMLGTAAYQAAEQIFGRILPVLKSTAYSVLSTDNGKTLVVSGTTTITLPAASAVYNAADPFSITVKAVTAAVVTVARTGSDTIETVAGNKSMTANTSLTFFPTSTGAWETI